ncbi:MAG: hypothetical protein AB7F35_18620, partial [Acetobacteraceae bacterium]
AEAQGAHRAFFARYGYATDGQQVDGEPLQMGHEAPYVDWGRLAYSQGARTTEFMIRFQVAQIEDWGDARHVAGFVREADGSTCLSALVPDKLEVIRAAMDPTGMLRVRGRLEGRERTDRQGDPFRMLIGRVVA